MYTELFGFVAAVAMVTMYALERRGRRYVLGFAIGCAAAAVYATLIRSWPFAGVEAVWTIVAVRRFASTPAPPA